MACSLKTLQPLVVPSGILRYSSQPVALHRYPRPLPQWSLALPALVVSGASDWADGWAARRFNQPSVIGSYLDPLADKVLICSVVGALGWSVSGLKGRRGRQARGEGGRVEGRTSCMLWFSYLAGELRCPAACLLVSYVARLLA